MTCCGCWLYWIGWGVFEPKGGKSVINWKVRVKNRAFWLALIPAVLLAAQVFAALLGFELATDGLEAKLLACVNAVFAVLAVLGVVTDPTTEGISDSERAMTYDVPHRDGQEGG